MRRIRRDGEAVMRQWYRRPSDLDRTDAEAEGMSLPELCMALRMAVNGSADPWKDDDVRDALRYMERRILTWTESNTAADHRFDQAVRCLVEATIDYVRIWGDVKP
jgi:hypothetical protein